MRLRERWRQLWHFLRRDRATRELEEEMRFHLEQRTNAVQSAQQLTPEGARAAARRQFGNPVQLAESARDSWGMRWLADLRQDVRYAARRLGQRPGFAAAVVLVLALGIAASTAMFSAVDAAMLRPLPFREPQQLVVLRNTQVPFDPGSGEVQATSPRPLSLRDIDSLPAVFSGGAAYAAGALNLEDRERPLRAHVGVVTPGFFRLLGVAPIAGRTLLDPDGVRGAPHVVVVSWSLWQQHYRGAALLGQSLQLNHRSYEVIGIMPRGFSFPDESDLWIPMSIPATFETFEPFRGFLPSVVIARTAAGLDPVTASHRWLTRWKQELATPGGNERVRESIATVITEMQESGAMLSLQRLLVGDRQTALLFLVGATACLLLIACANVMNLLLSQGAARQRELAVREVLGASRRRVFQQLLVESLCLATCAALLGLALSPILLGVLRTLLPAGLNSVAPAEVDLRVLGFTSLLAVGTALLFGLWPALVSSRSAPAEAIKRGGGHGGTARGPARLRRLLVAAEVALTVVLLAGAGLMLRSFRAVTQIDRGMDTDHTASVELAMPGLGTTPAARWNRTQEILTRIAAMPGVTGVGAINDLPLGGRGGISITLTADGMPAPSDDERPFARLLYATPGYFEAMGVQLVAGRAFRTSDGAKVAVISAALAKKAWKDLSPLGRTFHSVGDGAITVIGVAADVVHGALDKEQVPAMYFPLEFTPPSTLALVVRGTRPGATLLPALRDAVRAVDPAQAISHLRSMDDVLGDSLAPRRTNTVLITLFAALALLFAAMGVYAVVAHAVAWRHREFGIRAALGATGREIVAMLSREMLGVLAGGLGVGLVGAWLLTRLVAGLLYGVSPHDPTAFLVAPLLLALIAAVATLVPARRALRVSPIEAIRAD